MVTHTRHPSSLEHGLADDCPRCRELAEKPLRWLDREHLAEFWKVMLRVEYGYEAAHRDPPRTEIYRSDAEARCCRVLLSHAEFLLCIGINPRSVLPGVTYPHLKEI